MFVYDPVSLTTGQFASTGHQKILIERVVHEGNIVNQLRSIIVMESGDIHVSNSISLLFYLCFTVVMEKGRFRKWGLVIKHFFIGYFIGE